MTNGARLEQEVADDGADGVRTGGVGPVRVVFRCRTKITATADRVRWRGR